MPAIWAVGVDRETYPARTTITLGRVRDVDSKMVIAYARITIGIKLLESELTLQGAINRSVISCRYEE